MKSQSTSDLIQFGLCHCGCGLPTIPIAKTCFRRGRVKGQPNRYIVGHNSQKKPTKTYRYTRIGGGKLLKVHRLRAEAVLGKPLPPNAVVHHADGSFDPGAPLVICQDQHYHLLLHRRMRIVKAGGNPNTQKLCSRCHLLLALSEFGRNRAKGDGLVHYCLRCARAYCNAISARRRVDSAASAPLRPLVIE